MIEGLCKEVEKRMTHVGVTGSKVTLKVKQRKAGAPPPPKFLGHGKCHNLSKSTDTKTGEITRDWARFHEVALALFAEMKVADEDVRGMGVIISNLAFDNSNGNTHGTTNRGIAKWLTRQAKADTTTESRDAATTDEPLVLDEWEDESVVDVSTDDAVGHQDCDDIALPNLSQIHMSQVEALPLDIRQQILSKMASVRSRNPSSAPAPEDGGALSCDSRFRQTDVKRMLRMASVKSGACKVQSEAGNDISVTQLECLPLEMQLQVTNDDVAPVGALSAEKRGARPAANRLVINLYDDEPSPTRRGIPDGQSPCRRSATCAEPVETSTDRIRFYIDNVQPLVEFMNEHADADNEATHHVTQFLCLFVQEQHRLTDVTTLLRNIRNRSDGWSTRAFDGIFEAVDDMVEKTFQVRLDKEWVMQS
jgi:impB/mucB/samB family C-terminal domain